MSSTNESKIDEIETLNKKIANLEEAVSILQKNDLTSRSAISKLQNLVLGLFKKLLSRIYKTPENTTSVIGWSGVKQIMCGDPFHLKPFNTNNKTMNNYCGTDPICPGCRSANNKNNTFNNDIELDLDL